MDPIKDKKYLFIAEEGLKAEVPAPWKAFQNENGDIFYVNSKTKENTWKHPLDDYFRNKFQTVKAEDEARQALKKPQKNSKNLGAISTVSEENKGLKPIKSLPPLQPLKGGLSGIVINNNQEVSNKPISKKQAMMDLPPRSLINNGVLLAPKGNPSLVELDESHELGDTSFTGTNNHSSMVSQGNKKKENGRGESKNSSDQFNNTSEMTSNVYNESGSSYQQQQSSKVESSAAQMTSQVDSNSKANTVSGVTSLENRSKNRSNATESKFSSQVQKSAATKTNNDL